MHPNLTPVRELEELDRLLAESADRPLLIFKHSHTCGVSAEALDELRAHLSDPPTEVRYALIIVQTHRQISNAISQRLGVRHETPQAILVRAGRAVWAASHFRVNAAALDEALG